MIGGLPAATIGATGFVALTWGAIALVLVAFWYLVWTLVHGRATV